jgi:hypothetical protein
MKTAFILALLFSAVHPFAERPDSIESKIPHIVIALPADIPSEKIEIRYYLTGPFGGYGDSVNRQPNLHSYDITAGINGSAANNAKFVMYANGCSFVTFDIPIKSETDLQESFACKPLGNVPFNGKITTAKAYKGKDVVVDVVYISNFSYNFFGIADGMVTIIPVAQGHPDANGNFQVTVPDLMNDPLASTMDFQHTGFRFQLRDVRTGNILSFMSNKDPKSKNMNDEFPLAKTYPGTNNFVAEDNN